MYTSVLDAEDVLQEFALLMKSIFNEEQEENGPF